MAFTSRSPSAVEDGPGPADVTLATSPSLLVGLLTGQARIDDAIAGGQLTVTGSRAEARRFFKIFRSGP